MQNNDNLSIPVAVGFIALFAAPMGETGDGEIT
jgi:hypothetical protein